jgi:hypothetical protein
MRPVRASPLPSQIDHLSCRQYCSEIPPLPLKNSIMSRADRDLAGPAIQDGIGRRQCPLVSHFSNHYQSPATVRIITPRAKR